MQWISSVNRYDATRDVLATSNYEATRDVLTNSMITTMNTNDPRHQHYKNGHARIRKPLLTHINELIRKPLLTYINEKKENPMMELECRMTYVLFNKEEEDWDLVTNCWKCISFQS